MKIISTDYNNDFYCLVQMRDIEYLIKYKGLSRISAFYKKCIDEGKTEYDFVRLYDDDNIDIVLQCDDIIDFHEYIYENPTYLSRIIVNSVYATGPGIELKNNALRDIIAFQKGDIGYKIPLVPTREFASVSEKEHLSFETTILKGYYLVKSTDNISIEDKDISQFVRGLIRDMCLWEGIPQAEADIKFVPIDNAVLVIIKKYKPEKTKEKESVFKKIFNRKK